MQVIGTCSICGGAVTMPFPWYGIQPPSPTCTSCHAVKRDNGPVIDMKPVNRSEFEQFKEWGKNMRSRNATKNDR